MDFQIVSSAVESLGLGGFVFYLIRGLKQKISSLESVITVQKKTLDVMEKRIHETEKVGDIYRNLISNLPQDLENFKTIVSKTKDDTILELKNQQSLTQEKLIKAQQQIELSKQNPEIIKQHLKILKNVLSKPDTDDIHSKQTYDMASICEFGELTLENSVPRIVTSKTLEEFLKSSGFQIQVSEDTSAMKTVFPSSKLGISPKGEPIKYASSSSSRSGGWHLMVNDEFYANQVRWSELQDEFSAIKTFTNDA